MTASRIDTAEVADQLTCCAQDVSERERPVPTEERRTLRTLVRLATRRRFEAFG